VEHVAAPADASSRIEDFCAEAARNLSAFTMHEWQELLRTIIERIVFHGDRVTIQGRIPLLAESLPAKFQLWDLQIAPLVRPTPARTIASLSVASPA
jgi:hypothetical protein